MRLSDGQQRLTTLNLLFQYLSEGIRFLFPNFKIGNIPLTDAELVKALFLNDSNYSVAEADLRINLATEWNLIGQDIHDDRLWYFLNRSKNPMKY